MKSVFTSMIICFTFSNGFGQMFYTSNFGTGSGLPSGWTSSDARVSENSSSPSAGYNNSTTSPQASGGNNVIFQNCEPNGNTITLDVGGVIDCTGKTNIRVGFGLRRTNTFSPVVKLEYSTDGATYNLISNDISSAATSTWGTSYFDLLADADGVSDLRFRFTYITASTSGCGGFPPNFRIDDFSIGQLNSLPVELSGFNAQLTGNYVKLNWNTSSERNAHYFSIEKSADGKQFQEISEVQAAGESSTTRTYSLTDYEPSSGLNYYRLKQVDFDGSFAYSKILSISTIGNHAFKSFFDGTDFKIEMTETDNNETRVELLTLSGQRIAVETMPYDANNLSINVGNLPSGNYLVSVTNGSYSSSKMVFKPN